MIQISHPILLSKIFWLLNFKSEACIGPLPFRLLFLTGDFSVHHYLWLLSSHAGAPGEQDFNLALLNGLEQLAEQPVRIPDRRLDLCLTSYG